jgi:hypothetical protein
LDLNVVNVPKLLNTTYQLQEQMNEINKQQMSLLPPNGDLRPKKENYNEKQFIRKRINELEYELNLLKSQLKTTSTSKNS